MFKFLVPTIIVLASLNAQAYEVTYRCIPGVLNFSDIEVVYISVDADISDRSNKIYMVAIDDSDWIEIKNNKKEDYTAISIEIPLWGPGKFNFEIQNSLLSGVYKGAVYFKDEGIALSDKFKCVSTSQKYHKTN